MLLPSRSAGVTYSATVNSEAHDGSSRRYREGRDPGSEDLIARNRASGGGPVGASNSGQPPQIATADWLEELAVYGFTRNLRDQELAYQLSLAIENLYLVRLALRQSDKRRSEAHCG
jgi:hypothetical protein